MPDYVFPSKLVSEKIELLFDFTDELDWGETLHSWSCSVEVVSGDDDSPRDLLSGQATAAGLKVKQKFYKGISGVIYNLICDVTDSSGAQYRKVGKLAVLPDAGMNPPFLASAFLTTGPYPVDVLDTIHTSVSYQRGKLTYQPFPLDKVQTGVEYLTGDLYGGSKAFSAPIEKLTTSVSYISGDLYGSSTNFATTEKITTGVLLMSGDLYGNALAYSPAPESIRASVVFISGTLS